MTNVPILEPPSSTEQEPYIRLLVCRTCKTIDELPPWDGPAESDVLLAITVDRHGPEHVGVLYNVSELIWRSEGLREQVIDQIRQGGSAGIDVISPGFYSTRMQFAEDAMSCYAQHLRPKGQCPDYMSPSKRLLPPTKAERKEVGLPDPMNAPGPKVFLCQFCPVHVYNVTKQREAKGGYA